MFREDADQVTSLLLSPQMNLNSLKGISNGSQTLLGISPSVRSRPGPAGGLPRARDETGRQNVVRPRLSLLLVGQLEKMTGRDDKMPSVPVFKFSRTAIIWKDDKPHDLRQILVGGDRGR